MDSAWHLHELIPNSELIEVAECGHAMVFDQPKRLAEFLIQQLSRVEGRRTAGLRAAGDEGSDSLGEG